MPLREQTDSFEALRVEQLRLQFFFLCHIALDRDPITGFARSIAERLEYQSM